MRVESMNTETPRCLAETGRMTRKTDPRSGPSLAAVMSAIMLQNRPHNGSPNPFLRFDYPVHSQLEKALKQVCRVGLTESDPLSATSNHTVRFPALSSAESSSWRSILAH